MNSQTGKHAPPVWQYDETAHAGVDYASPAIAEEYDARHGTFRDYETEAKLIIDRLGLSSGDVVIDLGCGTGAFALPASRMCRAVHAVDVSPAMLNRLEDKARAAGRDNIQTHCAGFLTYQHTAPAADAIVSVAALHHLPDFWKAVALKRMFEMLRPGGKLYLFDVVFDFSMDRYEPELATWIETMKEKADPALAAETIVHIRDEYSTFDWVIRGMLERTGFRVDQASFDIPHCMTSVCVKPADRGLPR